MPRRPAAFVAFVALVAGALAGAPGAARAETMHRAAVIVEGDGEVRRIVVQFPEDSITGIELLRRAGADPVVYSYSGIGGAVCRLFGLGRDAGPDCLGGSNGDARYWAYFRAPAGSTSFSYAVVGGGSTSVRDGDVEGWRYGTGAAPAYASIDTILGVVPPPTSPPPTVDDAGTPGVSAAPGAGVGPGARPGSPGGEPATTAADADPSTDGAPTDDPAELGAGPALAARPAVARRGAPAREDSRGPQSLVILVLGLVGLGGAIGWARRSRRAAASR